MSDTSGMTPKARIAWPNIFQPRLNDLNGKMEYSCQLLIPKGEEGLEAMKEAAHAAAVKKWGSKIPAGIRSPFRDGDDEKEEMEDYEGMIFVNMKSNDQPGVVDEDVNPIIEPKELMPGDYVRCTFNAYAYDAKGNKGVAFGLRNVQKVGQGTPLKGARTRAEDDFGPVGGGNSGSDAMSREEAEKIGNSIF